MTLAALSLLSSLALAADPAAVPAPPTVAPATTESHITVVRQSGEMLSSVTLGIVLWCAPDPEGEYGRVRYLDLSHRTESERLVAALTPRSDIGTLVIMNNPTSTEVTEWLNTQAATLNGDVYREVVVSVACPAVGGDTDEELLLTRDAKTAGSGLSFADLATGIGKISGSSIWALDTSRDLTSAITGTSYGATADDVTKYGLREPLGISTGSANKYAGGGLISAIADVIVASKGQPITLDALYYSGIKPALPKLDLATSMGLLQRDTWNENGGRIVFIGGPLIVPITDVEPPRTRRMELAEVPTGCWMAGAGVLTGIATTVIGVEAGADYTWLADVNAGRQPTTNEELNERVDAYRAKTGVAIGLGAISAAALIGGTTWTILEVDHPTDPEAKPAASLEFVPTPTSVGLRLTF